MGKCFLALFVFPSLLLYGDVVFTVTNNADSGAGSYRQALINLASSVDTGNATINFSITGQTITLLSDLPTIGNTAPASVTINGNGNAIAGNNFRAYVIGTSAGAAVSPVTINNLSISGARARGGNGGISYYGGGGGGGAGCGGAYFVNGSLAIVNSNVMGCSAVGGNGGNGSALPVVESGAGGGGASFSTSGASRNGADGIAGFGSSGGAGGGNNPGAARDWKPS